MGMHGEGQPGQSAVDVLADVAMGEAAMDLAGFAAGQGGGAGSGDANEQSREAGLQPQLPQLSTTNAAAEPSPPLKRSFEESSGDAETNGYFGQSSVINGTGVEGANGGDVAQSRETKRPRVEEQQQQQIPYEVRYFFALLRLCLAIVSSNSRCCSLSPSSNSLHRPSLLLNRLPRYQFNLPPKLPLLFPLLKLMNNSLLHLLPLQSLLSHNRMPIPLQLRVTILRFPHRILNLQQEQLLLPLYRR